MEPRADDVSLRDVSDEDLPILFEQQRDPVSVRMAAFPARDWEPFIAHWAKIRADPAAITLAIVADGQVVGNMLSFERDGVREVGYWLGREHWGRGIATRALAALLERISERPLHAIVAEHNVGSRRVLEKSGFVLIDRKAGEPSPEGEVIVDLHFRLD